MRIDIKCTECGKGTRRHDIGGVIYSLSKPSKEVILTNKVICPKCKEDISEGKCIVKSFDFMMSCIAANVCVMAGGKVPEHLRKSMPAEKEDFEVFKKEYSGRLMLDDR